MDKQDNPVNPLPPKNDPGRPVSEQDIQAGSSVLSRTKSIKQLVRSVRRPVLASMVTRSRIFRSGSSMTTPSTNIASMTAKQLADELWSLVRHYSKLLLVTNTICREESKFRLSKHRRIQRFWARNDCQESGTTSNGPLYHPGSAESLETWAVPVMGHYRQTSGAPHAPFILCHLSFGYGVSIHPNLVSIRCSLTSWI